MNKLDSVFIELIPFLLEAGFKGKLAFNFCKYNTMPSTRGLEFLLRLNRTNKITMYTSDSSILLTDNTKSLLLEQDLKEADMYNLFHSIKPILNRVLDYPDHPLYCGVIDLAAKTSQLISRARMMDCFADEEDEY